MRRLLSSGRMTIVLALGFTSCLAAQAMPSDTIFDIRSGPATTSLKEFATQAHLQLLFDFKAVEKLKTRAVRGQLTPTQALQEMLKGSGFTFHEINDHTIAIARLGGSTPYIESQQEGSPSTDGKDEGKTESSSLGALQVREASGKGLSAATVDGKADTLPKVPPLEEVIVTAEKRSAQLLDVPVPVTVLQASDLAARNQLRIQDYYSQVPGLQYTTSPNAAGLPQVAIRGIIAGTGLAPVVEPTVDGVPFGSSTGAGGGFIVPDFDPSNLQRIEVLKGPQGTLYGANSLGGLLQYVTVDPSLDAVSGRVSAGGSYVENGAQAGFNLRGALNVPLTDTLAARVSGFARQTPGYVDDPTYGIHGVNKQDSGGGHLAVLWRPSDSFSAKFTALFQHDEEYGAPYVDSPNAYPNPAIPITAHSDLALVQNRLPDTGRQDRELRAFIVTLDAKLDPFDHPVDLTSISSYSKFRYYESLDLSLDFMGGTTERAGIYALTGFTPGMPGVGIISDVTTNTEKETQEFRLSTAIGPHIDWLLGTFFTHENSGLGAKPGDALYGVQLGSPPVLYAVGPNASTYKEYAVFTDFTFKVTDRFDVQAGGRATKDEEGSSTFSALGPVPANILGLPAAATQSITAGESSDTSGTYLFTPRYKLIDDASTKVMVYTRFSTGFRPGGFNVINDPTAQGLPATYGPDRTQDYDLGIKADLLYQTLFVDFAGFYIDYKSIQLSALTAPGQLGIGNSGLVSGGRAKSDGVELQIEYRPLQGLTIDANGTYDDAVLRDALPPVAAATLVASAGDRLPLTARFVGNFGANYEFPLPIYTATRGFAGAQYSYTGGRPTFFQSVPEAGPPYRQYYGAYGVTNLQLGVKWNTWTAELYGSNVANKRGVLGGGGSEAPPFSFIYITPATYGFEVSTLF